MKRKLISMANKTLLVSIPTEIVRKYNLQKGAEVDVVEDYGEVRIKLARPTGKASVMQLEYSETLLDQLDLFYLCGFDKVEILSSENIVDKLQAAIDRAGCEMSIVEVTPSKVVLASLGRVEPCQLDMFIKRVFFIMQTCKDELSLRNAKKLLSMCHRIILKSSLNMPSLLLFSMVGIMRGLLDEELEQAAPFIQHLYKLFYDFSQDEMTAFKAKLKTLPDSSLKRSISLLSESIIGMGLLRK